MYNGFQYYRPPIQSIGNHVYTYKSILNANIMRLSSDPRLSDFLSNYSYHLGDIPKNKGNTTIEEIVSVSFLFWMHFRSLKYKFI